MALIRESREADLAAILAVVNEAALAYRGVIPADRWHEPYMPSEELAREIADGVVFWLAEDHGRLLGVMGIQDKADVALVRHAYVAPGAQRKGVGTRLLRHVRGLTAKPVLIGTWAAASWAIEFYRRNGFSVVPDADKELLLRKYWSIPQRQVETSVVLADGRWAGLATGRFDRLREIERLDPERDCQRIMHLSFGYEFCWDSTRALELALYRTYCVPSISALLDRTGEFYRHAQRRYDDTAILIAELCEWGYEDGRGREALERINWAHGHFTISNDDFLYVLSTFIYEPIRWIDRYGWRPTCRGEKLGYYYFWREVGTRMGIRDIPPSYQSFEDWARAYERRTFRYSDTNHRVGAATRDLFASWVPRPLAPLVRAAIYALLDDEMLKAFGFPRPLPGARALIGAALKLRGVAVRWLPPRRKPNFFTDRPNRTHPQGYEIAALGPARLRMRRND